MVRIPVVNAKGSSKNGKDITDLGYSSVLDYWEKEKKLNAVGVVKTCPCCGEEFESSGDHMAVGGHVLRGHSYVVIK